MKAIDNTIVTALPIFGKKASKIENKYLCHHVQMLAKDLNLLSKTYLKKHELIFNAPVVQCSKLVCIINNHFSNFLPAGQVKIIYIILNEKETRLDTLIKSIYKRINTVSQ